MKYLKLLFVTVLSLNISCEKAETSITAGSPEYSGTMTVEYEGRNVVTKNVKVRAELSETGNTLDVKLLKVKFVPDMPVSLDILVPGIPAVASPGGAVDFEGDGIVPYALGGRFEKYTVSGLKGRIVEEKIEFSLVFGEYPTSYSGVRQ